MRRRLFIGALLLSLGLHGILKGPVASVSAMAFKKDQPVITLDMLNDAKLGNSIVVSGSIKDSNDQPISDKSILFTIGDQKLGQARSDQNGNFERKFNNEFRAGDYIITATSNTTKLLEAATASTELKITPAVVRIQTVPALAGIRFIVDERTFTSDVDGSIRISFDEIGQYRLQVLTNEYSNPTQRIEFGRWLGEVFEPVTNIHVPEDEGIQVGLDVYHLVSQSFVDMDGNAVEPGRVSKFTIRSTQGDYFEFTDGQPRWLPASRSTRRLNGLEETKLLYSVIEVVVNGSNVVNKSQQRFYTQPGANWEIMLLFNSIRVSAQDAILGSPVGQSVNLEFPDGSIKNYPLDENGTAEIHALPRGNYYIEFIGTKGLSNRTPVALSRYQDVHSKVITHLDIAIAGMAGMLLALGLLLYGRPWLLTGLFRKFLQAKPKSSLATQTHKTSVDSSAETVYDE